jgi:hypothetical protein
MLFGLILDLAGGAGSEAAWIAAFATQALVNAAGPSPICATTFAAGAQRRRAPGNSREFDCGAAAAVRIELAA